MDAWSKFEEDQLPPKEHFYSSLNDDACKDEDYAHAQTVWNAFGITNMGEYHDLYLKTDVLLLADVFEEFRRFAQDTYLLDPCHYLTLPSYAWDACLRYTGVKLELLKDEDKYTFFEKGIRGGVSMISHRFARANNRYLPDYDANMPSCYIIYLDANNLYGKAMVDALPVSDFEWIDGQDINWLAQEDDQEWGYVTEVDLSYPQELHDAHNCLPLAPEKMKITREMLSPYQQTFPDSIEVEKLVPNLMPKQNYVVHYRNLRFYLEMGMAVTVVHRVLRFRQRPWMAPYILV
jgi:hypothetical protein